MMLADRVKAVENRVYMRFRKIASINRPISDCATSNGTTSGHSSNILGRYMTGVAVN